MNPIPIPDVRCHAWRGWLGAVALAGLVALPVGAQTAPPTAPQAAPQAASTGATSAAEAGEPLFAVQVRTGPAWDPAKPPQEQKFFREHSAHLKKLRDEGRLVLGARYAEVGLVVLQAANREQAQALMAQDPSMQHGTFRCEVDEFNVFYGGTLQPKRRRP